jgi:hypothetical protein
VSDELWPSPAYSRQVERLRAAIGETIYLAELADSEVQLAVRLTDRPFVLLGIIEFPRPDPVRGLTPHLILLDDGRGVNLGRIARITRRPFSPAPADLLYLDTEAHENLLFSERRLTADFIAQRSRAVLGQCLGKPAAPALAGPGDPSAGRLSGPAGEDAP